MHLDTDDRAALASLPPSGELRHLSTPSKMNLKPPGTNEAADPD